MANATIERVKTILCVATGIFIGAILASVFWTVAVFVAFYANLIPMCRGE